MKKFDQLYYKILSESVEIPTKITISPDEVRSGIFYGCTMVFRDNTDLCEKLSIPITEKKNAMYGEVFNTKCINFKILALGDYKFKLWVHDDINTYCKPQHDMKLCDKYYNYYIIAYSEDKLINEVTKIFYKLYPCFK